MKDICKKTILLATCVATADLASAQKPNIILILADDMGYGDISAFNEDCKFETPNLDRLCQNGIRFTDAHASSSLSTPSRYGILTGRYAFRTNLKSGVLNGYSGPLIPEERSTIATMLSSQGYSTACIGKWHLGWDWTFGDDKKADFSAPIKNGPTTRGFDYFYGIAASLDMAPYVYVENDRPTAVPNRVSKDIKEGIKLQRSGPQSPDFEHADCLPNFTRRAIEYIDKNKDSGKPFFLYLPLTAPHTPILPSKEFLGKSGISEYCDFVMMVDDMVGQIEHEVEQAGILDNTIIIFTADNGCAPYAGIKEMQKLGHYPSYIYRGAKSDIYDGGHRIPLIISWGSRYHDVVEDGIISLTDFYATFADITGYTLKDNEAEDSYSMINILERKGKSERKDVIHESGEGRFALRKGKWKLIFWPGSGGWSNPTPKDPQWDSLPKYQLYDMKKDPSEKNNLYGSHKKVEQALYNSFKGYILDGRSTPGYKQKNDESSQWKQIEFIFK